MASSARHSRRPARIDSSSSNCGATEGFLESAGQDGREANVSWEKSIVPRLRMPSTTGTHVIGQNKMELGAISSLEWLMENGTEEGREGEWKTRSQI